ncbi:MAG: DUF4062 domain-containing protein [bacterium]|nr:DUF4062 domain-containing protein [bacterium]
MGNGIGGRLMAQPGVMVSSTFYDLQQIRADLQGFIADNQGYNAVLSEHRSFPVDPDVDTVENCRRRVKQDADILVLVVGGRYGSIHQETDKSITNLEYEEARAKGIPVYTFVDKRVLAVMSAWRDNKEGDFSSVVDTPRLFEFIDDIRSQTKAWVFEFETAQDIIATLRVQWAHLFAEALAVYKQLTVPGVPEWYGGLSTKSVRLLLDRPDHWEYLLFFQTWLDEISRSSPLLREYDSEMTIRRPEHVPVVDAMGWLLTQTHNLKGLNSSANELINVVFPEALGPDGVEGNDEQLVWAARSLGEIYRKMIEWSLRVKCANVDEPFDDLARELARFPEAVVQEMQRFPGQAMASIVDALAHASDDEPTKLELTIVFELSNEDAFNEAFERAKARFESGDWV